MIYKDIVEEIRSTTSISLKEINVLLKKFKKVIMAAVKRQEPVKWNGFFNINYKLNKQTRRVLDGREIHIPEKIKAKIKLSEKKCRKHPTMLELPK